MAGVAALAAVLVLSACQEVESNLVRYQPYELEPVEGTDLSRIKLDDDVAAKVDLQTARVGRSAGYLVVPHESLIYNPYGGEYVYTRPAPQTYLRAPVEVSHVVGEKVFLADGPSVGTVVVTVGAAELLATEYEILNQHP